MRQVISGITYDTDTATAIATGDHGHELSQAWWTLYRNPNGVYFEVVADHDGVVSEFNPLTDAQARTFLERNANSLVERFFGPMPEASRALFSRRTVIAAIDVIEIHLTQAEISSMLTDFGPDVYEHVSDKGSAKSRMVELKQFIDRNPRRVVDDGLLENVIVSRAASMLADAPEYEPLFPGYSQAPKDVAYGRFRRVLSQDGFTVSDGSLRRELPADIGLPVAEAELIRLLDRHGLAVAKGHLDQAFKTHANAQWAAANSQIRTFVEALFDELAVKLDPAARSKKSGRERLTLLANLTPPLLERALGEWADNGVGFINGLIALLNTEGSHPGLSDEEDSTFRLHIVLLTAGLFLGRFDKMVAK